MQGKDRSSGSSSASRLEHQFPFPIKICFSWVSKNVNEYIFVSKKVKYFGKSGRADKMQRKADKMSSCIFFPFVSMVAYWDMQNIREVLENIWVTVVSWNISIGCRFAALS